MQESIFEKLIREFSRAVDDVREKVVERPWFGEAVTGHDPPRESGMAEFYGKDHTGHSHASEPVSSYEEMLGQLAPSPMPPRERDQDIER
jgi:hypothetical protein